MSREIKFRVWVGEMLPVNGIYLSDDRHIISGATEYILRDSDHLIQYTGLKDKNGKEIYEGDIVYIAGTGNCEVKMDCCGYWAFGEDRLDYQDVMEDLEQVIGNIYENPEAL